MRRLLVRLAALLFGALVMLPSPMSAKETVQQRVDVLLPGADLILPEGKGPFPVVIQMHGCGGKKGFQLDWAQAAKAAGWAVIVVDSYRHRGISSLQAYATICTGLSLWGRERAGDLYAMMEWARHQGWADPNRIAAAGWSHGGWTALDAMSLRPGAEMASATRLTDLPPEPLAGLVGAFLVYPYCGFGSVAWARGPRVDVPIKALVGTADVIVGNQGLAQTLRKMKTPGKALDVVLLEGATHAFDEPTAKDMRVRYDPAITENAHGMYVAFLKELASSTSSVATPAR